MTPSYDPTQLKARCSLAPQIGRFLSGPNPVLLAFLAAPLFFLCLPSARAATINAASVSQADVAAAVLSAVNGDKVVIPVGSATWTTALSIQKAITLQGAGIGLTVITNGLPTNTTTNFVTLGCFPGKTSRITGIEFKENGTHPSIYNIIIFGGNNLTGSKVRIDHCKFTLGEFAIGVNGQLGVIDHNEFIDLTTSIYLFHATWNQTGGGQAYGYGSLADSSHFGTDKFMFIEDNSFTTPGSAETAVIDSNTGARWVFRYNTVTNGHCEAHAGGGGFCGTRAGEIYNNTFINGSILIANLRSGVYIVHDNTATVPNSIIRLVNYQLIGNGTFGIANGKNPWDVNLDGHPFYTGTATSGAIVGQNATVTVSGSANWTTNQWRGYSVVKTAGVGLPGMITAAEITSNTANTLTYARSINQPELSFSNGDTLEMNKVIACMDMIGRVGGSLITAAPATPTGPRPAGWNNQITEPSYEWNNTFGVSGNINFDAGQSTVYRLGEHYKNDTPAPGYTPYTYPHPLRSQPSNLRVP